MIRKEMHAPLWLIPFLAALEKHPQFQMRKFVHSLTTAKGKTKTDVKEKDNMPTNSIGLQSTEI